jgi:transposase-like protein
MGQILEVCPQCDAPIDEMESYDGVQEVGGGKQVIVGYKCPSCTATWTELFAHFASVYNEKVFNRTFT